ncbi:SigB/SigF/SigG family RNA polymerase sigma factor [Nonomuraea angiospora]|uniref:SigB/SigF/SigG family RNA polymerase sigma factor n=1 Tax=Nonomuraea angiospora TaxID=46172 RepID=UPI00344F7C59
MQMTVQILALDGMTAEELLMEPAKPQTSETDRMWLRDWLLRMHAPLARQVAHRYRNRGEPMEDLVQAAYVGMVKAINGFDAALGHAFRGYAAVTMLGEVKRHFRDRTWAVRVPHRYQERRAQLNRVIAELTHDLGRCPTNAELAHRMGITEEETAVTLEAASAYSTMSLDAPIPHGDDRATTLADLLPDYDEAMATLIDKQAVKPLIDALPERERNILLLRFYGDLSQAEIAAELGISQMHVSRILRGVLDNLRGALCDQTDAGCRQ